MKQGGGCRCLPNLLDRHWFSLPQLRSCPAKPNPLVCGVFPPSPGRLPPRSVPISHCAAARTLLHSPRGSAVRRPASGPPLPPLSSSHSSRHARRAAVHTVVTPCPDRTAPRCTALPRTSRLRCRIGYNDCGSTRPNHANLFASMRSLLRLRRFDPSINRGFATNTSCPPPL